MQFPVPVLFCGDENLYSDAEWRLARILHPLTGRLPGGIVIPTKPLIGYYANSMVEFSLKTD